MDKQSLRKRIDTLQNMKQLKKDQPSMFRGTKISQKQFDNLIEEWSKSRPWAEINKQIRLSNKSSDEDSGMII